MKKPLIGVSPLFDTKRNSYWMLPGYMQGVEKAGGLPLILPLTADPELLRLLAGMLDGLLLTGGQDVAPALYGETVSSACGEICAARDALETALLQLALDADMPVLGICRGLQMLNVFLGGSLYQDLPSEHPSGIAHHMTPPYDRAAHEVALTEHMPLRLLLGAEHIGVNSCHHQAVKQLAAALRPMASSHDGLVEAAYLPEKRFVWAVQWHPELTYRDNVHSGKLFQAFVAAASK